MCPARCGAFVIGPFRAHFLRPILRVPGALWNALSGKCSAQEHRHVLLEHMQARIVRQSEAEYFCHGLFQYARVLKWRLHGLHSALSIAPNVLPFSGAPAFGASAAMAG